MKGLLKNVFLELDVPRRKLLINYFNEKVFKKYLPLKKKMNQYTWRTLIIQDEYFIDPKMINLPIINQDKEWQQIRSNVLNKNETLDFFRDWIVGDCWGVSLFDGNKQYVLYDTNRNNGDSMNRSLLQNKRNVSNIIDKGLIIIKVLEDYYCIIYKESNGRYIIIMTYENLLDGEDAEN